jgi:hypothetical protein
MNEKMNGRLDLLDAEDEVNQHARRLTEALEGLRWGLIRTSNRIERVSIRARRPIDALKRQPRTLSIPIVIAGALALLFGARYLRENRNQRRLRRAPVYETSYEDLPSVGESA